ncbi:hypothetical protein [Flavihumibacter petaseus]|uniref:hypothetical protein n=1 Tax=Flavihumibacter petaseus TaxID=549295 RepID=UPI00061D3838|nr:hypothetical protein [Flavihumibacter petaseus]
MLHGKRLVFVYGTAFAVLVFLLQWLEYRFLILDHAQEVFTVAWMVDLSVGIEKKKATTCTSRLK